MIETILVEKSEEGILTASPRETFTRNKEAVTANKEVRSDVEGEVGGKNGVVLAILRARFRRIPKRVENIVCQMTDPMTLDLWAEHAVTCRTIHDFEEIFS